MQNYFIFEDGVYKINSVCTVLNPKVHTYYRVRVDGKTTDVMEVEEKRILEMIAIDYASKYEDLVIFNIDSYEEAKDLIESIAKEQNVEFIATIPIN